MSRDKQMVNDLIEIFDEEYSKRYLITPQNTAEKMTDKGYRKASEVAAEIFEEIEKFISPFRYPIIAEIRRKYTEGGE